MKSSPNKTDYLTREELHDLLSGKTGKDDARVSRLLNDCELSADALEGYNAVPGAMADLPSLNKQIAAKSGMAASVWMNVLTIGVGVTLLSFMGYALWPHHDSEKATPVAKADTVLPPMAQTNDAPLLIPPVDLTPKGEHFVNPEAKPVQKVASISAPAPKDSVVKSTPGEMKADPIAVQPVDGIEPKPVVPEHPEPGYNASVGYILDLKVTEFEKYYHKTISVPDMALGGVSAEFEDEKAKAMNGKDLPTTREVPAEKILEQGLQAFRDGRYGRCIEKMETLKKSNASDLNAVFYMAVSYVKLEMYNKALPLLDQVLNSTNNVFHEEARWYRAQALLGQGDTAAAKQLLNEIAAKEGFYQQKAKEKLAAMK